ncbi:MAG: hypothetical protein Q7K42_00190, partial [Candidatus Diapherotrites archaeon]|nr:hypothetical protein [Candidatus Diapherotrites archaeon]
MKKTNSKKSKIVGQVAMEYMMLIGFVLAGVIVIFMISNNTSQDVVTSNKIDSAVTNLGNAIDRVYSLGPGSRLYVEIDLPSNVRDKIIQGNNVGFKFGSGANPYNVT